MPRHHIVCIDGTGLSASALEDSVQTNVFKIQLGLSRQKGNNDPQFIYYYPGVGSTYYDKESSFSLAHTIASIHKSNEKIFASTIASQVACIYTNLATNFDAKDKIYLVGFSRGAIACRIIASMISKFGLLKPQNMSEYAKIWRLHEDNKSIDDSNELHRSLFFQNKKVDFIGLFDAVSGGSSSYRIRHTDKYIRSGQLEESVRAAVHIIAIDEQRGQFAPTVWTKAAADQYIENIWMPGGHKEIGGMGKDSFFSEVSLYCMIQKMKEIAKLRFDQTFIKKIKENIINFSARGNIEIENEFYGASAALNSDGRTISLESHDRLHHCYNLLRGKDIIFKGYRMKYYGVAHNINCISKLVRHKSGLRFRLK